MASKRINLDRLITKGGQQMLNQGELNLIDEKTSVKYSILILKNYVSDDKDKKGENKTGWALIVNVIDKNGLINQHPFVTFAGHVRIWKNLDTMLDFVTSNCVNAQDIDILIDWEISSSSNEFISSTDKTVKISVKTTKEEN